MQNHPLNNSFSGTAFGMALPERTWTSDSMGYRFGFNNFENDNEVKGKGNHISFGDYGYDPRTGRRWRPDPMTPKYPNLTPYHLCANNPILFSDDEGKDYIVKVNHEAETITVTATFHVLRRQRKLAHHGAEKWNKVKNMNYVYEGNDGESVNYDINFEINVVEHRTKKRRNNAFEKQYKNEGGSNTFRKNGVNRSHLKGNRGIATHDGENSGINLLAVNTKDYTSSLLIEMETSAHEMGHTLGLGHWGEGLMKDGPSRQSGEDAITVGMVSRILYNVQIGKLVETGTDKQLTPTLNTANSERTDKVSETPENFNSGQVKEKPKKETE